MASPALTYSVRVKPVGTNRVYCSQAVFWYGRQPKRCSLAQPAPPLSAYVLRTTALFRSETVYRTCWGICCADTCITSYRYGLRAVPEKVTEVERRAIRARRSAPAREPMRTVGTAQRSPCGSQRVHPLSPKWTSMTARTPAARQARPSWSATSSSGSRKA
ncbi:hypothetical protein ACQPXS_02020 [Streptomyces sp. CA-142005]|uniref:hypothetical protein n=1 Tax=Streptomyces sp. CA-142005 TaxID=3240052 RepID=UPI003D8B0E90